MTPPLRLGIVGCGRAATELHLPALGRVAGVSVVALADTAPERLGAAARLIPAARRYTDPETLLRDADVEAVLVALPASLHTSWGEAALEAGHHLLIEKPLALTVEEGERLVAAAARSGRVAAVGYNLRHHRLVAAARARVAAGALGNLEGARLSWTTDIARRAKLPAWRGRRASGGGVLWELASHHWDLLRFLTGRAIVEVSALSAASTAAAAAREDDVATVAVRLEGGAVASCLYAQAAGVGHAIALEGSERSLEIDLYRFDGLSERRAGAVSGAAAERVARALALVPGAWSAFSRRNSGGDFLGSYSEQWRRFLAAVRDGAPPPCSLADGLCALRVAAAVALSLSERRAVEVDRG